MAKLLVGILCICFLGASTVRTSSDDYRRRVKGTRLCQKQYGSYYYHDVFDTCCPCSPCNSVGGLRTNSVISCIQIGADHCEAPYFTQCKNIGPPIPSKTPPVAPPTNASVVVASPPTVTPTTNAILGAPLIKSTTVMKDGKQHSTFSVILVAISVVILMCVTLAFTSVCCYLRFNGNHTSKVIEKLPKWWGCSNDTTHMSSEQNSLSSDQPLIIEEYPQAGNGIHPSPHASLNSRDGPHEMAIPVAVQPDSRMSSYDASVGDVSVQPPSRLVAESADYTSRHIVANRGHSQDGNAYPQGNTTVSGNNNVGLIATVGSHIVIHNLNFNCGASNPDHTDFNITNQQLRVEAPRTQRTFHESNQVTGNRLRGPENALHRQSSEISSNSSGPVENESQASSRFQESIAFRDQVWQMRNCTEPQKEEHSFNSDSSASGPCSQRSTIPSSSYRMMSSDMSFNISQRNSSGLPPQGDMVNDAHYD